MIKVDWQSGMDYNIRNKSGFMLHGKAASDAEGLTPIELLSGSLALCVSMSLVKIMEMDKVDPGQLSVSVAAEKAADRPSRVERFVVYVQFPKTIDSSYRNVLIQKAEQMCTIGNTLQLGAAIEIGASSLK
ncbi:OsmC family protein [Paenibacillus sp. GCM10027626]|uniref:OsmC family protein n=1 Tax=Paenibacillus sp. GCM10027626 TaxID=3273411 RepID=UPI00362688C0